LLVESRGKLRINRQLPLHRSAASARAGSAAFQVLSISMINLASRPEAPSEPSRLALDNAAWQTFEPIWNSRLILHGEAIVDESNDELLWRTRTLRAWPESRHLGRSPEDLAPRDSRTRWRYPGPISLARNSAASASMARRFCAGSTSPSPPRRIPDLPTPTFPRLMGLLLRSSRDGVALALSNAFESFERKQFAVYSKVESQRKKQKPERFSGGHWKPCRKHPQTPSVGNRNGVPARRAAGFDPPIALRQGRIREHLKT